MMTDYERVDLMLRAWTIIDGWGQTAADGTFKKWNWDDRLARAAQLVAWADKPPSDKPPDLTDGHINKFATNYLKP